MTTPNWRLNSNARAISSKRQKYSWRRPLSLALYIANFFSVRHRCASAHTSNIHYTEVAEIINPHFTKCTLKPLSAAHGLCLRDVVFVLKQACHAGYSANTRFSEKFHLNIRYVWTIIIFFVSVARLSPQEYPAIKRIH